ncbi:MAG: CHAT domain-containing protein [Planctomycetota bacterium]
MVAKLVGSQEAPTRCFDLIDQAHAIPLELMRGVGSGRAEHERQLHEELRWLYQRLYLDRRMHGAGDAAGAPGAVDWRVLEARQLEVEQALERSKLLRRVAASSGPQPRASQLIEVLRPAETLVEYFPVHGRWNAALVTRDRIEVLALDASVTETYRLCQALQIELLHVARTHPQPPSSVRTTAARAVLEQLADRLLVPIGAAAAGADLLIAPHGHLWLLPFAALSLLRSLDFTSVVQVTSLCDLQRARERPARARRQAAVLGGGDADLPSAHDELASVIGCLAQHRIEHLGDDLERRPPLEWIHIAGHGIRRDDNPYFGAIRTAHGFLSAAEIAEMDLGTVELVVLSGCETGRGSLEIGRELGGLTLAFLGAQARAVLSSMWPVDDAATYELMRAFYQNVFTRGWSVGRALHRAEIDCARENRARHPYYWGAFRLVGDCDPPAPLARRTA